MMFKQSAFKSALVLGGLVLATGLAFSAHEAKARVYFGVGIGAPFYYPPPYYYGPSYYGPPAVVYAPPPVVYQAPSVSYTAPPPQYWYYCDSPKGYYPYVNSCAAGWRQVQPTATPPTQ